ncbi:MAG: hypothetical protein H6621_08790 [Halobacteriovoraceae bacterium]|nr:hypothetical protein [Halobacteriovoraceae bacterium]MCB9095150.1 hypothetical protein [Halobacteriovoraceae bacterium]
MSSFLKSLRIVVLNNACNYFEDKDVRNTFGKFLATKRSGYNKEYMDSALPFDTTDFFSTHLAICQDTKDGLNPICVYKSVPLSLCRKHNVEFCPLTLIEKGGSSECHASIQTIVKNCLKKKTELSYDCSWTVVPEFRKSEHSIMLRELAMALGYWHHHDYNIPEWMTCGILRMKTDKFFFKMGHHAISSKPIFKHPCLNGEEAVMVHLEKFSRWATDISMGYQNLWENRLELGDIYEIEIAAAA